MTGKHGHSDVQPPHRATLFPLPVAPFESFMLADDRPAYPMTYVFQLTFTGRIDRPAFENALAGALERHPLLGSRVVSLGGRRRGWQPSGDGPPIDWDHADAPLTAQYSRPLDLTRQIGLRIWVREGSERTVVYFQFHHACCDGAGAVQFFEDLFVGYAAAQDGNEPPLAPRPIEPERLAGRGYFGMTPLPVLKQIPLWVTAVREAWKFFRQSPRPLASPDGQPARKRRLPDGHPGYLTHVFDGPALADLRRAAEEQGVSLNDLLVRDVFLALDAWNRRHDRRFHPRRWLRVMVPCNLRSRDDRAMPAANVMSYTFVDRRASDCRQPEELLAGVRDEIAYVVRWRMSLYFIGAVATADMVPLGLKMLVSGNRCFASAVMTNVGDLGRQFQVRFPRREGRLVVGNLVLDDIFAVAPIRPSTAAVFCATVYGGRLTIALRCDPYRFSLEAAKEVLDTYVVQIERSRGLGSAETV